MSPRAASCPTRAALLQRLLQLDVPWALALLDEIFPASPDTDATLDFAEPPGQRADSGYAMLHEQVFQPMQALFEQVREVSAALAHEVGAFG